MKKSIVAMLAACAAGLCARGATLSVPSEYQTVEAAVTASQSGDEVVVAAGTYALAAKVTVPAGVTLRGATGDRDDVVLTSKNVSLAGTGSALEDLTVSGVTAADSYVGGVYLATGARMVRCRVTGCLAGSQWNIRGIGVCNCGGTVSNCVVDGCSTLLTRCVATGVYQDGAGAMVNCVVTNNIMKNGTASLSDGSVRPATAVQLAGGSMVNCYVADNSMGAFTDTTTTFDAGVGVYAGGSSRIVNSTIVGNTYSGAVSTRLYGIALAGSGVQVVNTVVLGNGNTDGTESNLDPSSLFDHCAADASAASNCTASVGTSLAAAMTRDAASGIFVPGIGSPLVDAGSEQAAIQDGLDVLGNARLSGAAIDIGAAEQAATGALACQIDASATEGVDSLTATLTATAEGDTNGLAYYWDTDGDTSTWEVSGADKASIQLEFGIGSCLVTLKVTNGQGEEATASKTFTVSQSTYYVDVNSANPLSPYGTAATAATNLADVLSLAGAGTTVRVAPGAYSYAAATNLAVPAGVSVVGASGNRGDVVFSKARFVLNANAAVRGVTIADAWTSESYGGGVRMNTGSRLLDCAVWNCVSGDWNARGCGVYNDGGVVSNCVVSGCHATLSRCMATGVYQKNGGQLLNCVITNCTMSAGTASVYTDDQPRPAAAVFLDGGSMANCYVADNSMGKFSAADSGFDLGSGVYAAGSSTRVVNTLVYQNTYASNVSSRVYGIVVTNGATVVNTAVFNNGHVDGTLANLPPSESFDHCATDATAAKGCLDSVGATMAAAYRTDPASGLWRPQVVGPLVNAGLTQADLESGLDLAGNPRLFGRAIDIGPFESQICTPGFVIRFM